MIPKSKIEEACDRTCNEGIGVRIHNDSLKRSLFKAGVFFAEEQLEILAIEFANWLGANNYKYYTIKEDNFWMNFKKLYGYTTKELFEIFKQTYRKY
jgi:hypothetical protein